MSKYGEKKRKENILKLDGNVRYPKNWEIKMIPILKSQYPSYDNVELHQVLGGIWNNYNIDTKIKIIEEYQTVNRKKILTHKNEIGRLLY